MKYVYRKLCWAVKWSSFAQWNETSVVQDRMVNIWFISPSLQPKSNKPHSNISVIIILLWFLLPLKIHLNNNFTSWPWHIIQLELYNHTNVSPLSWLSLAETISKQHFSTKIMSYQLCAFFCFCFFAFVSTGIPRRTQVVTETDRLEQIRS